MGSEFTKDKNVDIGITLKKDSYYAGENVEGEVLLNVKKESIYHKIQLRFTGEDRNGNYQG